MDINALHDFIDSVALQLFPERFNTPAARALVLAIGLQESHLVHRRQLVGGARYWWQSKNAPAAGFFGFERIGIRGVMKHRTTGPMARAVLQLFSYPEDVDTIHEALTHNDILAVAFARLALWRIVDPLPGEGEWEKGWEQYLSVWRPGKPRPDEWKDNFAQAWEAVKG